MMKNNKLILDQHKYKKFYNLIEKEIKKKEINLAEEIKKSKEEIKIFFSKKIDFINGKYVYMLLNIYLCELKEIFYKKNPPKINLKRI